MDESLSSGTFPGRTSHSWLRFLRTLSIGKRCSACSPHGGIPIPGNDDALRAIRLFTTKIADSVAEGRSAYEQSRVADQKAAADQALVDGVEYVDTSAYEQYEKQEGDFVEPTEATAEAAAAAAGAPAEATVPPDEESR